MSGIAEIDNSATLKLIADQTHYPHMIAVPGRTRVSGRLPGFGHWPLRSLALMPRRRRGL